MCIGSVAPSANSGAAETNRPDGISRTPNAVENEKGGIQSPFDITSGHQCLSDESHGREVSKRYRVLGLGWRV
jgi:hypothetical protein